MRVGSTGCKGRVRQLPPNHRSQSALCLAPACVRRELAEQLDGGQAALSQAELLALTHAASRTLAECAPSRLAAASSGLQRLLLLLLPCPCPCLALPCLHAASAAWWGPSCAPEAALPPSLQVLPAVRRNPPHHHHARCHQPHHSRGAALPFSVHCCRLHPAACSVGLLPAPRAGRQRGPTWHPRSARPPRNRGRQLRTWRPMGWCMLSCGRPPRRAGSAWQGRALATAAAIPPPLLGTGPEPSRALSSRMAATCC